jgi:hypothetical protein
MNHKPNPVPDPNIVQIPIFGKLGAGDWHFVRYGTAIFADPETVMEATGCLLDQTLRQTK